MQLPHMAFVVQSRPLHHSSCVHLWPNLHPTMDCSETQTISLKFVGHNLPLKCSTIPLAVGSYVARQHPLTEVDDEATDYEDKEMHSKSILCSDSQQKEGTNEIAKLDYHHSEGVMTCTMRELKENLRRKRIGMANKGKIPWNKGRKHTAETCARIREKTLEAMKDPKVKRRLSETPHKHSEQSKKKIATSLRQIWVERRKLKRSKEKFYISWAGSVAGAAREGGINEEELDWDSYEMLKEEIARRKCHLKEQKIIQRIQAAEWAKEKAQNMGRHSAKQLDQKNKGEPRAKQKVTRSRKARKKNKESLESSSAKTEEKTKTKEPLRTHSGAMSYLLSALDKFDIESIKEEQKRKTISLADQIQAAKIRRQILSNVDPQ